MPIPQNCATRAYEYGSTMAQNAQLEVKKLLAIDDAKLDLIKASVAFAVGVLVLRSNFLSIATTAGLTLLDTDKAEEITAAYIKTFKELSKVSKAVVIALAFFATLKYGTAMLAVSLTVYTTILLNNMFQLIKQQQAGAAVAPGAV